MLVLLLEDPDDTPLPNSSSKSIMSGGVKVNLPALFF